MKGPLTITTVGVVGLGASLGVLELVAPSVIPVSPFLLMVPLLVFWPRSGLWLFSVACVLLAVLGFPSVLVIPILLGLIDRPVRRWLGEDTIGRHVLFVIQLMTVFGLLTTSGGIVAEWRWWLRLLLQNGLLATMLFWILLLVSARPHDHQATR